MEHRASTASQNGPSALSPVRGALGGPGGVAVVSAMSDNVQKYAAGGRLCDAPSVGTGVSFGVSTGTEVGLSVATGALVGSEVGDVVVFVGPTGGQVADNGPSVGSSVASGVEIGSIVGISVTIGVLVGSKVGSAGISV